VDRWGTCAELCSVAGFCEFCDGLFVLGQSRLRDVTFNTSLALRSSLSDATASLPVVPFCNT
jgi:hypothetical protein